MLFFNQGLLNSLDTLFQANLDSPSVEASWRLLCSSFLLLTCFLIRGYIISPKKNYIGVPGFEFCRISERPQRDLAHDKVGFKGSGHVWACSVRRPKPPKLLLFLEGMRKERVAKGVGAPDIPGTYPYLDLL